jgi:hydrogenase maturation protease
MNDERPITRRVLVAGIGNIFMTDDAFGVEVAHRLAARQLPAGARVEDFGIRGVHLAYELLEGYDALILIDAVPMDEPPGTLAVMAPESEDSAASDRVAPVVDAHTMNPDAVLATLSHIGGSVEQIFIVGCQPANLQEGMGLSAPIAAVVDDAVEMCVLLITELFEPAGKGTSS